MNSRNILQNRKEKQLEEKSFQNLLITYCVLIVIQSFRNVLAQNRLQLTKIKKMQQPRQFKWVFWQFYSFIFETKTSVHISQLQIC